jgi:hypothetical protein
MTACWIQSVNQQLDKRQYVDFEIGAKARPLSYIDKN